MSINYSLVMNERLGPTKPWRKGIISSTRAYTLEEAARLASMQADMEVTVNDFLTAASEELILMRAIVQRQGQLRCCIDNDELPTNSHGLPLGTVPKHAIVNLPIAACRALANAGHASWRVMEGYRGVPLFGGKLGRYARWELVGSDPDFETVLADCRIGGDAIHALADALSEDTEVAVEPNSKSSPETTPQQRRDSVADAVARHGGNQTHAAKELGISRARVWQILNGPRKGKNPPQGLAPSPQDPFGIARKPATRKGSRY